MSELCSDLYGCIVRFSCPIMLNVLAHVRPFSKHALKDPRRRSARELYQEALLDRDFPDELLCWAALKGYYLCPFFYWTLTEKRFSLVDALLARGITFSFPQEEIGYALYKENASTLLHSDGTWHRFGPGRWISCADEYVDRLVDDFIRQHPAKNPPSTPRVRQLLSLLLGAPSRPFDKNRELLAFDDGAFDFSRRGFRQTLAGDMILRTAGYPLNASSEQDRLSAERWLNATFCDPVGFVRAMRKLLGPESTSISLCLSDRPALESLLSIFERLLGGHASRIVCSSYSAAFCCPNVCARRILLFSTDVRYSSKTYSSKTYSNPGTVPYNPIVFCLLDAPFEETEQVFLARSPSDCSCLPALMQTILSYPLD